MGTEINCFSCLAPNATHPFGPNIYCDKCIQTFIDMEAFMRAEIARFKAEQKLLEEDNG